MGEFGHTLLLVLSVGLLGSGSLRLACALTTRIELRVVAAATVACFAAIAESLLLGLGGLGNNAYLLTAVTAVLWLAARWQFPRPEVLIRVQAAESIRSWTLIDRSVIGAMAVACAVSVVYLIWHPYLVYDSLTYHLAEPAIWLHTGKTGWIVATNTSVPVGAYPRNTEVLVAWLVALGRTGVVGPILMFGFLALGEIAMIAALDVLAIGKRRAAVLAAVILLIPIGVQELSGPISDLPTLVWIMVTAALCAGAINEAGLLPIALLAAGVGLGTKTTAGPAAIVMLLLAAALARPHLRRIRVPLAIGAVLGGGLGALWYVVNWGVYGAPLYPFYSFPSGPPVPAVIKKYGVSFLSDPRASIRAGTLHGYFHWLGGGSVILAGTLLAVATIPWLAREQRRWMYAAVGAAVLETVLWMSAPYTGFPGIPGTEFYPLNGIRYLYPGLPLIASPMLLLWQQVRWRRVIDVLVAFAAACDIWSLRYWPAPLRPPGSYLLVAVVVGAVVGAATLLLPAIRLRLRPAVAFAGSVVAAVGVAAAIAGATGGWDTRAAAVPQPDNDATFAVQPVVAWIVHQPSWRSGHQDVAVGPLVDVLLAGPHFQHRLVLLTQSETCAQVVAMARTDWMVIAPGGDPTFHPAKCLPAQQASFTGGGYEVFAPGSG